MDLSQQSDTEILAIAEPIMSNLMDASTAIDYERHVRDFTERARGQMSKERLQAICHDYQNTRGVFAEREFVALFRRPTSVAVVWKQRFSREPGEFVAEMVLVQHEDRYLVDHVMVF